jgi:hypothetical protein
MPGLQPPLDTVVDVISSLLADRSDASLVLASVAVRIGLDQWPRPPDAAGLGTSSPGPQTHPDSPTIGRAALADAFARWHAEVAVRLRLQRLSASVRRDPAVSESPELTRVVTRADKDAKLLADAVELSPPPTPEPPKPRLSGLPFITADQLPPELRASKDFSVIRNVVQSPEDRTLGRWRRRALYTEMNWADWAEWQPTDKNHRDAHESLRTFSDPSFFLTSPGLRSPNPDAAADAWNVHRRHLRVTLRHALTVGCAWTDILVRLSTVYSDPEYGYSRLLNYVDAALDETALLPFPLLHADVLIYKLDVSYSFGSTKYQSDANTANWDRATSRLPGEDPVSLAVRVISAFLDKQSNTSLDNANIWENPTLVYEINNRYAECLLNDEGDPARGQANHQNFMGQWARTQALHEAEGEDKVPFRHLSCEYLARYEIVPFESATISSAQHDAPDAQADAQIPLLPYRPSRPTGAGARARRDAMRAASGLGPHAEEPPPHSYLNDRMPDDP